MPLGPNNRKILDLNSPGTATTMGGDDYDILALWHENTDLTAGEYAGVPHKSTVNTPTEYRDNKLRFLNPAQTKSIRIRVPAITQDYDVGIPLITTNDDFLLLSNTAQIYNKTISIDDNPIIATSIASGDLLKSNGIRFLKMARGLPGQVLTVKNDGLDLEWADPTAVEGGGGGTPDDNSVTTAKIVDNAVTESKIASNAVTVNKIGSGAVTNAKIGLLAVDAARIADATITAGKIANTTITAAKIANATITSTQIANTTITNSQIADSTITTTKLAGSITQDKLSQITDTAKLPSGIVYRPDVGGRWGLYAGTSTGANPVGEGILSGNLTSVGTGEYAVSNLRNGPFIGWGTAASTGSYAGIRSTNILVRRAINPTIMAKFDSFNYDSTSSGTRIKIGFNSATTFGGDAFSATLNNQSGAIIGFGAGDINYAVIRNDGDATTDQTSTSVTVGGIATATVIVKLELFNAASGDKIKWTIDKGGTITTGDITTELPADTTNLYMQCQIQTNAATTREMGLRYVYVSIGDAAIT
jgi:hypothetical protein